jgi:DNA modification methylase
MTGHRKDRPQRGRAVEPSAALNALCPYYTMFPLEFPLSVLGKRRKPGLRVLDPFCGRGTTIFAARLKGHQAYGIDSSPIAIAIARAKLAETTDADVVALAERIFEEQPDVQVPKGDFWEWAYAPPTLREVCILREGLRGLRSGAADMLRGICLGALHGPLTLSVETRSYFSNQMPRTFAAKPNYSLRYWKANRLWPVAVDVLNIVKNRLARLQLDTLPKCAGNSRVSVGDARLARGYASVPETIDLVITSPPYYGMRTYVADQWLRNWFLGGPPAVPYGEKNPLSHQSPDAFAESLAEVWDRIGVRLSPQGRMFVRFGAIPSRKRDSRQIMESSLEHSRFPWKICRVRPAESAASGKRQACHMGRRITSAAMQEHDYEIALR